MLPLRFGPIVLAACAAPSIPDADGVLSDADTSLGLRDGTALIEAGRVVGRYDGAGLAARAADGRPGPRLRLAAGEPGALRLGDCAAFPAELPVEPCEARVEADHGGVVEWWAPRPEGLEHGVEVHEAPPGGRVQVEVTVEGGELWESGGTAWIDVDGTRWSYAGLVAWDRDGAALPAALEVVGDRIRLTVNAAGARFPVTLDPVLTTAEDSWTSTTTADYFGMGLGGIGDVNGDGWPDMAIGAPYASSGKGKVYVYHGSSTGFPGSASTTFTGSGTEFLGWTLCGGGDLDGDGYDDLLAAAPYADTYSGRVYAYYGSASGLSSTGATTLSGVGSGRGWSLGCGEDVDADGYPDVMVGSDGSGAGGAWLHLGGGGGLTTTAADTVIGTSGDSFGTAVALLGDTDGDGYAEVAVGGYAASSNRGKVVVYSGDSTGLDSGSASTLQGPGSYDTFGYALAGAGDVNGDGYADLLVGGYSANSSVGRAWVHHGTTRGFSSTANTTIDGGTTFDWLGRSVAGAGDVDADGYDDVFVGAPTVSKDGFAELHPGSASGVDSAADSTLSGAATNGFGGEVRAGGDVNADGYADVFVSERRSTGTAATVYLHLGYADADGDGYIVGGGLDEDCDDTDATVNPGAAEVEGDGLDGNCDGAETCAADADDDGYRGTGTVVSADGDCDDAGEALATDPGGDCDDENAAVSPGTPEVCDAADLDEDCDGAADDADASASGTALAYTDADGDGYGDPVTEAATCNDAGSLVAIGGDCDDGAPDTHPGANEVCGNDTDEDCDGAAPECDDTGTPDTGDTGGEDTGGEDTGGEDTGGEDTGDTGPGDTDSEDTGSTDTADSDARDRTLCGCDTASPVPALAPLFAVALLAAGRRRKA